MRIEKQGDHFIKRAGLATYRNRFFSSLSPCLSFTYFQVIFLESLHLPPRANERAPSPIPISFMRMFMCSRAAADSSAPACLPITSRSLSRPIRPRPSCCARSLVERVVPFLHIARSRVRVPTAYPLPKCFAFLPA